MRDIPLFTVTDGMATLILHEIPFRGEAYVWVRSLFGSLDGLMQECAGFCRAAGAEKVYFSGEMDFGTHPVHARLIYRCADKSAFPITQAVARPVTDDSLWLEHYRKAFRSVPVSQSTPPEEGRYDVYLGDEHIGIGQVQGGMLMSIASLKPGMGTDCLCALAAHSQGNHLRLVCAQENIPAMKFYDKLGFSVEEVKEVWYSLK